MRIVLSFLESLRSGPSGHPLPVRFVQKWGTVQLSGSEGLCVQVCELFGHRPIRCTSICGKLFNNCLQFLPPKHIPQQRRCFGSHITGKKIKNKSNTRVRSIVLPVFIEIYETSYHLPSLFWIEICDKFDNMT